MKISNELAIGLLCIGAGIWLFQRPNCNRGCKTIAEHILNHGLGDVLAALG